MPHSGQPSTTSQGIHDQQYQKRSRNPLSGLSRPAVLGGKKRDKDLEAEQRERSYSNTNNTNTGADYWEGNKSTSTNTSYSHNSVGSSNGSAPVLVARASSSQDHYRQPALSDDAALSKSRSSYDSATQRRDETLHSTQRFQEQTQRYPVRSGGSTDQDRLAETLVQMLVANLPHRNAETGFFSLQSEDNGIAKAYKALAGLCRYRLAYVIQLLHTELELVIKLPSHTLGDAPSPGSHASTSGAPALVPNLDNLRSQMFIAQMIAGCLASHWSDQQPVHLDEDGLPLPQKSTLMHEDPPPLDDKTAKQLLGTVSFFCKQSSMHADLGVAHNSAPGSRPSPSFGLATPPRSLYSFTAPSSSSSGRKRTSATVATGHLSPGSGASRYSVRTNENLQIVAQGILESASSIAAYLSASRWDIMLVKLRNRIQHFSTEEHPDLSEVGLFEYCALNGPRLSSLLSELGSFAHLKRSAQGPLCSVLRNAIWRYITSYPYSFAALYSDDRKPSPHGPVQPENLFDTLSGLPSSTFTQKSHIWPAQIALLVLCPDTMTRLVASQGERGSTLATLTRQTSLSKKLALLDTLRKAARAKSSNAGGSHNDKDKHAALACYVDLCKAASFTDTGATGASALRLFVHDVESELKSSLLDTEQTLGVDTTLDVSLLADFVTSYYNLDAEDCTTRVLPALLDSNNVQSGSYIHAGLLAIVNLLAIEEKLPWHRQTQAIVSASSTRLSALFRQYSNSLSFSADDDLKGKQYLVLQSIIDIWHLDPTILFLLHDTADGPPSDAHKTVIDTIRRIATLVDEAVPARVRTTVLSLLLRCHGLMAMPELQLDPTRFVQPSSLVPQTHVTIGLAFARNLLFSQSEIEDLRLALELTHQYIQSVAQMVSHLQPGHKLGEIPDLPVFLAVSELAGVLSLYFADQKCWILATQCFLHMTPISSALCQQADDTIPTLGKAIAGDDSPVVGGRMAQAKRASKALKHILHPTPALMAAWDEAFRKFKDIAGSFGVLGYTKLKDAQNHLGGIDNNYVRQPPAVEDTVLAWVQLSSFLISTMGVYVRGIRLDLRLSSVVPPGILPSRFYGHAGRPSMGENFLRDATTLLLSEYPRMRDAIREQLGNDLDISLFSPLVAEMQTLCNENLRAGRLDTTSSGVTLYFDQVLAVLSSCLVRTSDPIHSLKTVNHLEEILLAAAYYTQRLDTSTTSIRLQIKIGKALSALFNCQHDAVEIPSHRGRNTLANYLLAFALDAARLKEDRFARELLLASLQALSPCLKNLIISLPLERDLHASVTDVRLMNTVLDKLQLLMTHALAAESISSWSHHDRSHSQNSTSATNVSQHDLRDLIVSATANALEANLSSSKDRLVQLALVDAVDLRQINLKIIADVTRRWPLQASSSIFSDYIAATVDIFCAPDLKLALCMVELCTAAEHEPVLEVLQSLLDSRGLLVKFLKAIIEREVTETSQESTLFRSNSTASRMLTSFARSRGYTWLRGLVATLLEDLAATTLQLSNLDLSMEPEADDGNLGLLETLAEDFLSRIRQSWRKIPASMRELCHHINLVVGRRFPDSVYTAIGGWIFLRFINPAVISPDLVDLHVPEDIRDARKALILVSKLLQALSNNIRFKEAGMKSLHNFVSKHILQMTGFLSQISASRALDESAYAEASASQDISEFDKRLLLHFVTNRLEQIGERLLGREDTYDAKSWHDGSEDGDLEETGRMWKRLTELTLYIQQASEQTPGWRSTSTSPRTGFELARVEPRGAQQDQMDEILKVTAMEDGSTMLFVSLGRVRTWHTDLQTLQTRLLQALDSAASAYSVLFDCTNFTVDNEMPQGWLQATLNLLSSTVLGGLRHVYFFCISSPFARYLKKLAHLFPFSMVERRFVFLASEDDLYDLAPQAQQIFHSETRSWLRDDEIINYTGIYCTLHHEHFFSTVSLGGAGIMTTTLRQKTIVGESKATRLDLIPYSNITSVHRLVDRADSFSVRMLDGSAIALLDMQDSESFIDMLQQACSASREDHTVQTSPTLVATTTTDYTIGTILAIAISSLVSGHEQERRAGYHLLAAIVECPASKLQEIDGIHLANECIPLATLPSLANMSSQMADSSDAIALSFIASLLSLMPRLSTSSAIRSLPLMKPWLSHLSWTTSLADPSSLKTMEHLVQRLVSLSLRNDIIHTSLQNKIWPSFLRIEGILQPVLAALVKTLARCDIDQSQKEAIASILTSATNLVSVRGLVMSSLHQLLRSATLQDHTPLHRTREWTSIQSLIYIDTAIAAVDKLSNQLFVPEITHLFATLFGIGTLQEQLHTLTWAKIMLSNVSPTFGLRTEQSEPAVQLDKAHQTYWEALTPTLSETVQHSMDGRYDTLSAATEDVIRFFIDKAMTSAPSEDAQNAWRARCANLAMRSTLSCNSLAKGRALVLLSHLGVVDDFIITALLTSLLTVLKDGADLAIIHTYLLSLSKLLQTSAGGKLASIAFWLAIATSQAHVSLLGVSISLLTASVKSIVKADQTDDSSLHAYLLQNRRSTDQTDKAFSALEGELGVEFSEAYLSFAIATLVVKGLAQATFASVTIDFLRTMAVLGADGGHADSTNGDITLTTASMNILGYIVALLPIAAKRIDGFSMIDLLQISGLNVDKMNGALNDYQSLFDDITPTKNEPLVLAVAMAMSLLELSQTDEVRIVLLNFLTEIAEISHVVLLLESRIMPYLSGCLRSSSNAALVGAVEPLLDIILTTAPDGQDADIMVYLNAMNFPATINCASFSSFAVSGLVSDKIHKVRLGLAADLLTSLLASTNAATTTYDLTTSPLEQ